VYPIETKVVMTVYFYFAEIGNFLGPSVPIQHSARLHFTEILAKVGHGPKRSDYTLVAIHSISWILRFYTLQISANLVNR